MENKDKRLKEYYRRKKLREQCDKIIERNTKMERGLLKYYSKIERYYNNMEREIKLESRKRQHSNGNI